VSTIILEKRQKLSLISGRKAILPVGVGALRFEGLHDRESSKEDLFQGLEYLASSRGVPELDKKEVPVLGIAAPSESGKTEFLRWIFNNCCTVSLNAGDAANNLLGRINAASPPNVAKLDRLIVLFASFNQKSTYNIREGPIVVTAIKRLVRSYQGRTDMQGFDADDAERNNLEDLVNAFSEEDKTTGFVVCIDELSKLRQLNSSA
jgi:hypothetical protein